VTLSKNNDQVFSTNEESILELKLKGDEANQHTKSWGEKTAKISGQLNPKIIC